MTQVEKESKEDKKKAEMTVKYTPNFSSRHRAFPLLSSHHHRDSDGKRMKRRVSFPH